jgi:deazaflavin-dependent oxidoreductase (nitroreductase family)
VNAKLTTTGRTSGQPRTVTLYTWPDDERLVIVGSRGGADHDPAWVHNLRADPKATIRTGKAEREMRAHDADGAERERLWELVTNEFPLYRTYQRRTERLIPLFVLEAVEGGP